VEEPQQHSSGAETAANVAAFDSLPGRTLYVRTDDGAVLRVGTVEGEDAATYLLSFASVDGGPRAAPERIAIDRVFQPEDIENFDETQELIYVEGRRLVHCTTPGSAKVLEIRQTLTQQARTVRARRLRYAGDRWEADEETKDYPLNESYPALSLARIEKWRYHQAVDPFFDIIRNPIGSDATIESAAELVVGGVIVPIHTKLVLSDLAARVEASAHPTLANLIADLDPKLVVRATVRSTTAQPPWVARYAAIGGSGTSWSFDGGHEPGRLDITSPRITVTLANGTPAFTREVFEGVAISAFTDHILRREPPMPMHPQLRAGPGAIRCALVGRPALIYVPPRHDDHRGQLTAVLYHGPPFKDPERRALTSAIGYLCGGRANHALTETFDVRRKLSITYTERGSATTRMSPPVPLDRATPHAYLIAREIPALTQRLATFYRDGSREQSHTLDAVLHHYAEGVDSAYSTTRTLRLAVAFEALVNLVTSDYETNERITPKLNTSAYAKHLWKRLKVCSGTPHRFLMRVRPIVL